MRELILQKLAEIEQTEHIRILYAVESGSRAWDFASPDSDYDVRFLYVREPTFYLRLDKTRDVLEYPINDLLDICGWDLDKTLKLMSGANPTIFEWLASPIIYRETAVARELRELSLGYFKPKSSMYHYLNMARSNYNAYLQGETVRAKKYFYALRPILAANWIAQYKTQPPMRFQELMDSQLPDSLRPEVLRLLELKINAPEIKEIAPVQSLNAYITDELHRLQEVAAELPDRPHDGMEKLNRFFLAQLKTWQEQP